MGKVTDTWNHPIGLSSLLIVKGAIVMSLSLYCSVSVAELQRFEHVTEKADGSLTLLVVGDWGRRGTYNQSRVAFQMGKIGERLAVDFIISTGDNFYDDGLTGTDDSAFQESFSYIYTAPSLQKQWYNVLGNHDYRGDVEAQLSPLLTMLDSRWVCLRSFIINAEFVDFIFVDTTPFVDKYFTRPKHHVYDWRGVLPRQQYLSNLLKDVELALKESRGKWKVVIGHHTLRSVGHHGDTKELLKHLLPLLLENKVDAYVNGHDHCMQHIISNNGVEFMTSGGGSKAWKGDMAYGNLNPNELKFYHDGQGFMSMKITQSNFKIAFYDVFGNVIHQSTTFKHPLFNSI